MIMVIFFKNIATFSKILTESFCFIFCNKLLKKRRFVETYAME